MFILVSPLVLSLFVPSLRHSMQQQTPHPREGTTPASLFTSTSSSSSSSSGSAATVPAASVILTSDEHRPHAEEPSSKTAEKWIGRFRFPYSVALWFLVHKFL